MNHDETHVHAHEKAIADMTAESYLLSELSEAEADAFEQHYFDCRVCADTIRAGMAMLAAGRAMVKETPSVSEPAPAPLPAPLPFRKKASYWMSLAASAVLAFSIGTQSPWLRPATSLPALEVADPGPPITTTMRGSENTEIAISMVGDRPVELYVFADTHQNLDSAYRVVLKDASGKVIHSIGLTPRQAFHEDGVPVLLRALPAGRYFLAIEGVRKEGNRHVVGKFVVVQ
jgi:hypothetical protein